MPELKELGRYKIDKFLGSGAFADVYRAIDTQLQRVVALKVLKAAYRGDQEIYERFKIEAQAAASLNHPHIAWVWDLGEEKGHYYITIRFIEGQSLDKIIRERGCLPWSLTMKYALEIGSALTFAHRRGLVHRDIKPQNIIISPDQGAVLTDFGLAKAISDSGLRTRAGTTVGTPQYIPPEVWDGEIAGAAADQYALACMICEMLTGKILYQATSLEAIIKKHMSGPYEAWVPLPEAPAGAEKVLRKALSQIARDRYPDIESFIEALKALGDYSQPEPPTRSQSPNLPLEGPEPPRRTREGAVRPTDEPETSQIPGRPPSGIHRLGTLFQEAFSSGPKTGRKQLCYGSGRKSRTFSLDRKVIHIGRQTDNEISIADPEISRHHARLTEMNGAYYLEDLGSANGTYLNDVRVKNKVLLKHQDRIRLGSNFELIYRDR